MMLQSGVMARGLGAWSPLIWLSLVVPPAVEVVVLCNSLSWLKSLYAKEGQNLATCRQLRKAFVLFAGVVTCRTDLTEE